MADIIINPFDEHGFTAATLTEKINKKPAMYGMIRNSGIFKVEPVYTSRIVTTFENGKIRLLKTKNPKEKPNHKERTKAERHFFETVHVPYQGTIWAADLAEKMKLSGNTMQTLMEEMQKELNEMKDDHAITEEFFLVKALQGVLYDADGTTLINNFFDEFSGVTKETQNFTLGTSTTDVAKKCKEIVRHVKKNIGGDVMTGVECICDSVFFDNLTGHDSVKEVWKEHQATVNKIMSDQDPTQSFSFSGITFKEYAASAPHPETGAALDFIGTGKAHFYPKGTTKTGKLYYSPARNFSAIGKPGQPLYARQTMDPKEQWIDIDTEQNLFPIWTRPECLVEGDDGIA
jgi:hypothetical protein